MLTFVRITEAGSLSAAARQLGTTQPTVSRRLQALEKMLGVALIRRTTHEMQLTEEGQTFFGQAKELLEQWSRIESGIKGTREEPLGLLRVQMPHALGQDHLIPVLAQYLTDHPQVAVEWILTDRAPNFVGEDIDCVVQAGTVHDPSVVATRIAEIPRILVAAPALLARYAGLQDPGELAEAPWLALQTFYRDRVDLFHTKRDDKLAVRIHPRLRTDSLYVIRRAALLGLGFALCSAWIVQDDLEAKRLVHVLPAWRGEPLPVYVVYPKNRHQPAKLKRFLDLLRRQKGKVLT